jgi:hypothetical protein
MIQYCVYLTIYEGSKLPKYYIGSTTIDKINNGYFGSVLSKKYKCIWNDELKNNIHLFDILILETFESRQEAFEYELKVQRKFDVIHNPNFINMAYATINGCFGAIGNIGWNLGLSKETNENIAKGGLKQSLSKKGRTKNNHSGIAKRVNKMTGRTKENHSGVASMAAKKKGRTKDVDQGTAAMAEKLSGRTKEHFPHLMEHSRRMTGRTKENNLGIKIASEKRTKILPFIRNIIVNWSLNGYSNQQIHKWIQKIGYNVHYSSISRIKNQTNVLRKG